MKRVVMTADPSSRSMGVALWSTKTWKIQGKYTLPVSTHLLQGSQCDDWDRSVRRIGEGISKIFNSHQITKVYCEQPAYMPGSHQTAGSGGLVKLTHSAGMIAGICYYLGIRFEYVPINQWKGNLPKKVVNDRIKAHYKEVHGKEVVFQQDEWDAVGIGLYLKGIF